MTSLFCPLPRVCLAWPLLCGAVEVTTNTAEGYHGLTLPGQKTYLAYRGDNLSKTYQKREDQLRSRMKAVRGVYDGEKKK